MLEAKDINNKLKEKLQEKCIVYPQNNLRCSSIGHPCLRYVYLCITNCNDRKPPDVGLQSIFGLGNKLEDYVIEKIKEAGFEVITPTTRSFKIQPQNISGREDLRIKDPETGELIPVEIKSISPYEFDKLNSFEDFVFSKKPFIQAYASQLQLYMYQFEKFYGFFALINKVSGEIKFIKVDFNFDFCEQLLKKAEYINECLLKREIPEPCECIGYCENCDLQHICGSCQRVSADIELDDELEQLIEKQNELKPYASELEEVKDQIKKKIGEREKVITGNYLIERKSIEKKSYTVQARTEWRLNIKKLG